MQKQKSAVWLLAACASVIGPGLSRPDARSTRTTASLLAPVVPVDFNGDGLNDIAVYRPSLGAWVVPASGGTWIPITDATLWADKPRWGPVGKTIYFISNRQSAFFDAWGIRFDSTRGRADGAEFRVTRYENPGQIIATDSDSGIALSERRLVVPITDVSGSVWVLDNIKR